MLKFMGRNLPHRKIFPTTPPTGTVHTLPLFAFQLAVMIGAEMRYQPFDRL
jgi:hypothetical protein